MEEPKSSFLRIKHDFPEPLHLAPEWLRRGNPGKGLRCEHLYPGPLKNVTVMRPPRPGGPPGGGQLHLGPQS